MWHFPMSRRPNNSLSPVAHQRPSPRISTTPDPSAVLPLSHLTDPISAIWRGGVSSVFSTLEHAAMGLRIVWR